MKCPDCKGKNFRKFTEFHKAACPVQFLIEDRPFCYDCQSDAVKNVLDNPRKSCDGCAGTLTCANSEAAESARAKNNGMGSRGGNYRPCKRGESPKPRKSGYSASDQKAIKKGDVRYNKDGGYWEKRK